MEISLCYTIVSPENKMLLEAAAKQCVQVRRIVDSEAVLQGPAGREVLQLLPGVAKKSDASRLKKDEGKINDK